METILASLVAPAAVDMLKNLFASASRKWIGLSVDDQIKLENANIERLKALALLDNPNGTPSQWVINLRGASRYVAVILSVGVGAGVMLKATTPELEVLGFELVAMPVSFLFGERMYLGFKGNMAK